MKCKKCGTKFEGDFCPNCNTSVSDTSSENPEKSIFKLWYFWAAIVVVLCCVCGIFAGSNTDESSAPKDETNNEKYESTPIKEPDESIKDDKKKDSEASSDEPVVTEPEKNVTVADFSTMSKQEIESWASENNVKCQFSEVYSDTVEKGAFVSQSVKSGDNVSEGKMINISFSLGKEPSSEYKNALKSAERYSKNMHMSRKAIYNQLTSQYGGKFTEDAAQYALDNLDTDYKINALESAKSYNKSLHMSKKALYDQLVSEYGGKFTEEEAQYALDNLDVDYKDNALISAKKYQSSLNMSRQAIYDQLISEHGGKFTKEEAQYAIDNLGD